MSRYGAVRKAYVFRNDVLAGTLEKTASGGTFNYEKEFLDIPEEQGIGSTLPLRPQPYETLGVNLHPFFANLLPEGLRLDAITAQVKASRDDRLSVLLAAGEDSIGDVSVRLSLDSKAIEPSVLNPQLATFRSAFESRFGLRPDRAEHVSIAGVQEKVSASRITAPFNVQKMGESIVKMNFDQARHPRLIENEHYFMRLAAHCGLAAARCELIHDADQESALAVQRFDRVDGRKLHQEDACQLLDLYPDHKYDVPLQTVAKRLEEVCTAPKVEILRLLELYAYCYIIGNGDLHAKNISILREPSGLVRLSPAYDLLSTWPYGDFKMALQLDGRDDNFKSASFVRFGERFGVNEKATRSMLSRLINRTAPALDDVASIGFDQDRTKALSNVIRLRRDHLAR